ncbi:MAG: sterol desaturase family protein [bacterium]|nr:sterol desaturase family protein [bacterium]
MFTLYELFTDPIILAILGLFAGFALVEAVRPGRRQTHVRGWRLKGVLFLFATITVSSYAPLLWDGWFGEHRLIDATGLGNFGGAAVGFLVLELGIYVWHRTMHRVDFLWRWFHQMHHSAERMDLYGAFYFHPLDTIGFALVTSASLVLVLGLTAPAAIGASLAAVFCSFFQHTNLRTPRWLGYFIVRPESHSVHHQRGVHAHNYSDLPLWDMVFGTFRNPAEFEAECGFWDGASREVLPMLAGRDVSERQSSERPSESNLATVEAA